MSDRLGELQRVALRQVLDIRGLRARINAATKIARMYGGIDGAHHKDWVIDQMCRALLADGYGDFVLAAKDGENGPETYRWETGIAP